MSGKQQIRYATRQQITAAAKLALATHAPALRELARRDAAEAKPTAAGTPPGDDATR